MLIKRNYFLVRTKPKAIYEIINWNQIIIFDNNAIENGLTDQKNIVYTGISSHTELENMLKKQKAELYVKNLEPMSMEQFNADIDQSLEDSANDRIISTRDLKEEVKKWR